MIKRILVIGTILAILLTIFGIRYSDRLDLIFSNPNSLIRHFAPTWRSLKKILDVPYVLASAFYSSDLPVYNIALSASDRAALIDNLPDFPREYKLTEEFKNSVKGELRFGDYYTDDAGMRYRGVSPNHWSAVKKSLQVNLPDETPLGARGTLRFFIPEDKGWVFGKLSEYRAKKLGLLTPDISYAWLVINKVDAGIYYLIEGWEENFLVRNNHPPGPTFANENVTSSGVDLYRADSVDLWEDRFYPEKPGHEYEALAYFLELVERSSDSEFERALPHILNLPQFYKWMVMAALSNSFHQGNIANQNVYFNEADGKFEQISFDTALSQMDDALDVSNNRLVNRMMQIPRFRDEFTKVLQAYVNESKNLADDLAFYDATTQDIKGAILDDTKKVQTSYEVLRRIELEREMIEHNFNTLKSQLDKSGALAFRFADESYPPADRPFRKERFYKFSAVHKTREEFLQSQTEFARGGGSSVVLPAGTHIFTRDTIIPTSLLVIIEPGARFYFAPNVSLISYSPIMARNASFERLLPKTPWGVVAVVNAGQESAFEHVLFDGGKDATINGIYMSGMLSLHNSDARIEASMFRNSSADDALHIQSAGAIVRNSRFEKSFADAIDIDFARGDNSLFEHNTFWDIGGDAMDLSFSEMQIRDNTVTKCGDKGISVGEASKPTIEKQISTKCIYGIAVKDRSHAVITNSILKENEIGLGLYRKKPFFVEGGTADVRNTIFEKNKDNINTDQFSSVEIHEN